MEELFDDPAALTPAQRRREIAAILARGVLRLHQTGHERSGLRFSGTVEESAESRGKGLDEWAGISPHALVRQSCSAGRSACQVASSRCEQNMKGA